jgi:trimethylamine--corrinoid protein Co-methyltransferase
METFVSKREPDYEVDFPVFRIEKGTTDRLAKAARLCEHLDSWDSFLRTVNIQDDDINDSNKDVNKFFASLNNTTKHVMSGLTQLSQLDNVVKMAQIIAGGEEKFRGNPIISFITCVIKSPLQLVADTTQTAIEVAKRGIPLVISSSPQGGSTAPIREEGMVAQINAEIMTGIALTQLINKGTPVLYGSVPGRASMDDLNDSYGVPEFSQYNIDCVQMARYYGLPCYSTGGVSDVSVPGIQASVERLFSHILVTLAGPQYIHYAFGLLERTNTFCPVQAVLDDTHISMVKRFVKQPTITADTVSECLEQVRRVMASSHKLYVRFVRRALHSGEIAPPYPFQGKDMVDETLLQARERMEEVLSRPPRHIDKASIDQIFQQVPGLLTRLKDY